MARRLFSGVRKCLALAAPSMGLALLLTAMGGVAWAQRGPNDVPEIDPSSAASALALIAGGVMLLKDKLRSK